MLRLGTRTPDCRAQPVCKLTIRTPESIPAQDAWGSLAWLPRQSRLRTSGGPAARGGSE
jgi:hypothetical protein